MTLSREAVAGVTTFFTMAYIVVVNPAILSDGTGIPFSGALTATVLLAVSMTLLMGLYARLPFGVAPGMGLNAFFAYTLIVGQGIAWPVALGIIFWAGVLFLLASLTPLGFEVLGVDGGPWGRAALRASLRPMNASDGERTEGSAAAG